MTPTERIKETIQRMRGAVRVMEDDLAPESYLPELRGHQMDMINDITAWKNELETALKEME